MSRPERIRLAVVGVGRGSTFIHQARALPTVELTAICDKDAGRVNELRARHPGVLLFSDYDEMLAADVCDAVMLASPSTCHAEQTVKAMRAGRHVLSEVLSGMTLDEIWSVVEITAQTGLTYMMAENYCYSRSNMMVLNMVREGVFGEITFAETNYCQDCKAFLYEPVGTWRYEWLYSYVGNVYPTHSIGPVAQWLDLGRGDRMASLVSLESRPAAFSDYLEREVAADHGARKETRPVSLGDVNKTLIRTERGRLIDLGIELVSNRPDNLTYYHLQGLNAAYNDVDDGREWVFIRDRTQGWDDLWKFATEYEHPRWRALLADPAKRATVKTEQLVLEDFVRAIVEGTRPPIDVYDAAAWSCLLPLSAASVRGGGRPVAVPDFTRPRADI